LIKETGIPYLVVGIEGKVEQILRSNGQLSRLFAVRETLRPFEWRPGNENTIKEFASFVQYVEKAVGVPLSDELPRVELLEKIHYATNGVVGNIMNLIRFASLLAQKEQANVLTLSILSQAFAKRLSKHVAKSKNPFAVADGQPLSPGPVDDPSGAGRRSKRRKDRTPTLAEVLTKG
jgi:hypothetical protein